jgi:hypothetical protein
MRGKVRIESRRWTGGNISTRIAENCECGYWVRMATNDETYIPYGALRSGRVCALAVDGKEYIVYDISLAFKVVCCEENAVEVEGFFQNSRCGEQAAGIGGRSLSGNNS